MSHGHDIYDRDKVTTGWFLVRSESRMAYVLALDSADAVASGAECLGMGSYSCTKVDSVHANTTIPVIITESAQATRRLVT